MNLGDVYGKKSHHIFNLLFCFLFGISAETIHSSMGISTTLFILYALICDDESDDTGYTTLIRCDEAQR